MEPSKKRKNDTIDIDKQPTPKRQSNIGVFFGIFHKKDTASNSNKESHAKKKQARSIEAATAEKWKLTTSAKYHADEWFVNVNKTTNLVQSMNCFVCTKLMA